MTRLFAGTAFDIPPECDLCGKLESECVCTAADKAAAEDQRRRESQRLSPAEQSPRVRIEKRKGNRTATVIDGLASQANDLPALLSRLQAACGTGGTVRADEDRLELQGEHAAKVRQLLAEIGYRVKT